MSSPTPRHRGRNIFQASLRSLLLFVLITGTVAGLWGPRFVQAWKEWRAAPPPNPPTTTVPAWLELRERQESDGYYESAETPLR